MEGGDQLPAVTTIPNVKVHFYNSIFAQAKDRRFFKSLIVDLYKAIYDPTERRFKFRDYEFKNVAIVATIITNELLNNNFVLEVEDGTGKIKVYVNERLNPNLWKFKENNKLWLENCDPARLDVEKKIMYELYLKGQSVDMKCPAPQDLDAGDVVLIEGRMVEYEESRHIFPYNILLITEKSVTFRYNWFLDCVAQMDSNTGCVNNTWSEQFLSVI